LRKSNSLGKEETADYLVIVDDKLLSETIIEQKENLHYFCKAKSIVSAKGVMKGFEVSTVHSRIFSLIVLFYLRTVPNM
jgi:hypothetical protein